MKNLILLLAINIFSICATQEICEQNLATENKQPLEIKKTFKDHCEEKVKAAKNGFNNGWKWIKKNPKFTASITFNIVLISSIIYIYYINDVNVSKLESEKLSKDNDIDTLSRNLSNLKSEYKNAESIIQKQEDEISSYEPTALFKENNLLKTRICMLEVRSESFEKTNSIIKLLKNEIEHLKKELFKATNLIESLKQKDSKENAYVHENNALRSENFILKVSA